MVASFVKPLAALLALLLAGCGGLIGPLPRVTKPKEASTVSVFRDFALPGLLGPIVLRIDGCKTFRLWGNQEFFFQLDPGEYFFEYSIGFNECRRVAFIQPRQNYRFRLTPNCTRFDLCVTRSPGTPPAPRQGASVGSNAPDCGAFNDQCY